VSAEDDLNDYTIYLTNDKYLYFKFLEEERKVFYSSPASAGLRIDFFLWIGFNNN